MEIKTSKLIDLALNWAVAKCYGYDEGWLLRQLTNPDPNTRAIQNFSTDWALGGPVIEQQGLLVRPSFTDERDKWTSILWAPKAVFESGPTPLIAAMRCYVASKLGDEVKIPEELE